MLTVGVSHEDKWLTTVYDVTKYKIDNTGVKDATAMVNVLLGHISNTGGGVLYFPAGRYRFSGTLNIGSGVLIKGDGYEYTQLFWEQKWREVVTWEKKDGTTYRDYNALSPVTMMSSSTGNFAVEGIEFAGGHTGTMLYSKGGNMRFENYRVNIDPYVGTGYGYHTDYYLSILAEQTNHAYSLFQLDGENNKILNSEFQWGSKMWLAAPNSRNEYFLIQNCIFDGTGPLGTNWSVDGVYCGVVEDCNFVTATISYKGDNVYMARCDIRDIIPAENREIFTNDVGSGMSFQGPLEIGEDSVTFTFPEEVTGLKSHLDNDTARKWLSKLCIVGGTGTGQWRYIVGYDDRSVIIDRPFDVAPDETSWFTQNVMYSHWYFKDIVVDNGGMFHLYTAQSDVVIDGMTTTRAAGIKGYGQQVYGLAGQNWYNSYANCNLSQGNYYHRDGFMDYWKGNSVRSELFGNGTPPGGSFIAAVDHMDAGCPAYTLNCTIRGNTLSNNCLIYIFGASENSMEDCIVDSNHSFDTRCGIFVEGFPHRLLLNANTAENVDTPIQYLTEGVTAYKWK